MFLFPLISSRHCEVSQMGQNPTPAIFSGAATVRPRASAPTGREAIVDSLPWLNITKSDGSAKRCHPHMFRDTFAVEMLLAGVPIDQVSILLGHTSVKITEKHYSPWVKARQLLLQHSVSNAWPVEKPAPKISANNRRRQSARRAHEMRSNVEPVS